jgi:hypothetical protein
VEDVTAADGVAVDGGDDRLGDVADERVEVLDVDADVVLGSVAVASAALPGGLVAADAEGPIPRSRQDDDAAPPVPPGRLEGVDQLVDRMGREGVELLRPVDGDGGRRGCRRSSRGGPSTGGVAVGGAVAAAGFGLGPGDHLA